LSLADETADVVVIGLGAAGAACAHHLARRGARVIALDRGYPPHNAGSSHGESRITRQAIGEGDDYVPLALLAHRLWREMESETGQMLMMPVGALVIGRVDDGAAHPGKPHFVRETIGAARRFAIPHEEISPDEARRRFPALRLLGDESVYFEPGAGLLLAERCVAAQIELARRHGAVIRPGETVVGVETTAGGVRVATDRGAYAAAQVVAAAGPWTANGLLAGDGLPPLAVYRQLMHWFEAEDPAVFAPGRFPVFIWMHGQAPGGWFYGFPQLPGTAGLKIADERFDQPLPGPQAQSQDIDPAAAAAMWRRHVAPRVAGVTDRCVRSSACLYTMAAGGRFLIGRVPGRERVILVSACSGHGFKHSAAIGELVAELATEATPPPLLAPFALPGS
jgi:sarcosine oxidase